MNKFLDIQSLRTEIPGTTQLCHFNNAGSALPNQSVIESIKNYLDLEAKTGGYVMARKQEALIQNCYIQAARLINCAADEIAIVENASVGFIKALYAIPFKRGDVLLTSGIEYGTNYLNYMKLRDEIGIEIRTFNYQEDGSLDLTDFESKIDDRVKLISITHIPTQSGFIAPAQAIGKIAKKHNILYLLDACQSVGQIPVDVQAIQCDFLSTTSRKYIRGPRGLGFLYVNKNILPKLNPIYLDMLYAEWNSPDAYQLRRSAKVFENWEKPYALIVGLAQALKIINETGIQNIWNRIKMLSTELRTQIAADPLLQCFDPGQNKCGIITFTKEGIDPSHLQQALEARGINTSVSSRSASYLDMHKRSLHFVNRASLHYYNTEEEVNFFISSLKSIA